MAQGQVFKRCGCRDAAGRQLGQRCPKLAKQKRHGSWYARYDEPPGISSKRRQPTAGPFPTKDDAQDALTDALAAIHAGTYQTVDRSLTITVDFDRWLDGRQAIKRSTRREHQQIGNLYIKPGLGYLRPTDLCEHHIEDLYAAMRQIGRPTAGKPGPALRRLLEARADTPHARRPLSQARIRRVHAVLHAYLNAAVRRHRIPRNPASNVELATARTTRALAWTPERVTRWRATGRRPAPVMVWTPDQAGAFLDSATRDRLYPLLHLVAYRGLRRAEALGLPWTDVDLDAGTITIRDTLVDPDDLDENYLEFDDPKTAAGERVLSLDAETIAVLAAWRAQQDAERAAWGTAWVDSGRVFTKENGTPLNPGTVSQHFDRLITRTNRTDTHCTATTTRGQQCRRPATVTVDGAPRCGLARHGGHHPDATPLQHTGGLPPIRFHDLRHTAASLTYRATRDLRLVSELLGHSSVKITGDVYTTLFADVEKAAAEAVAQLVPRTTTYHRAHLVHTSPETRPTPDVQQPKTPGQQGWS